MRTMAKVDWGTFGKCYFVFLLVAYLVAIGLVVCHAAPIPTPYFFVDTSIVCGPADSLVYDTTAWGNSRVIWSGIICDTTYDTTLVFMLAVDDSLNHKVIHVDDIVLQSIRAIRDSAFRPTVPDYDKTTDWFWNRSGKIIPVTGYFPDSINWELNLIPNDYIGFRPTGRGN